jgi:hypothetical protein
MDVVFFKKVNSLFIIFLITVIVSFFIIHITRLYTLIIPNEDDLDFENDKTGKQRWSTMMKIILVLLIVICLVYSFIMLAYYGYFNSMYDNGCAMFLDKFWYTSDKNSTLILYYAILFIVLIVMFLFYMIYTYVADAYFDTILYEKLSNKKDPDIEDIPQASKYLFSYCIFLIVLMLFSIVIINTMFLQAKSNEITKEQIALFFFNFVIVLSYMILTLHVLRHLIQRNIGWLIFYTVQLVLLMTFYDFILDLWVELMKNQKKDIKKNDGESEDGVKVEEDTGEKKEEKGEEDGVEGEKKTK